MNSGYLGAFILSIAFIFFTAGYWLLRTNASNRVLNSEGFATVFALLVTSILALGVTVFAGNAYLTDIESTIVSALVVLGAATVTAVTLWRVQSAANSATTSNTKGRSKPLPIGSADKVAVSTMPKKRVGQQAA